MKYLLLALYVTLYMTYEANACVILGGYEKYINRIFYEELSEYEKLDMIVGICYKRSKGIKQSDLKKQCEITLFWDHDFKHGDDSNILPVPNGVTKANCKQMEEKLEHDKLNIP